MLLKLKVLDLINGLLKMSKEWIKEGIRVLKNSLVDMV